METHTTTAVLILYSLVLGSKAGYFTTECNPFLGTSSISTVERQNFDVTDDSLTIYSHNEYGIYDYDSNYKRCINIWTNTTNHVIKLEEESFRLEESYDCIFDSLEIFYTPLDDANTFSYDGKWCGTSGPGTKYSSGSHMFLHFYADSTTQDTGFQFTVSSIHEDDIPIQLSTGAIVGIVFGVLVLIIIVIVIVVCVLIHQKKPGNVHPSPPGRAAPANRNVAVASSTNTMYNRQMVGGYMPPPQYQLQQQPPPYQTGYQMRPAVQPVGPPPPPSQDPAYPPPAALYNPPPVQHQQNGGGYPSVPPPAYSNK